MRIINDEKNKHHYEVFDYLGDFVKFAKDNPNPLSSDKEYDDTWHGPSATTLQDACTMATEGWTELRPEVDNVLNDVTERLADRLADLYKPTYDFGGAYVDMGRYVEGDPECMVNFQATADKAVGRVVKVVIAGTASWNIKQEWLMRRGVAVLSLIDTINKLGFGIELWWDSTVAGKRADKYDCFTTAVKLHDSEDSLDINSVMFALAHPSMLRRLTFSVQEQSEFATAQGAVGAGGGYGSPSRMGMPNIDDYDVVVDKLQDGHGDIVNDPMGWVMTTLKGLELVPETV